MDGDWEPHAGQVQKDRRGLQRPRVGDRQCTIPSPEDRRWDSSASKAKVAETCQEEPGRRWGGRYPRSSRVGSGRAHWHLQRHLRFQPGRHQSQWGLFGQQVHRALYRSQASPWPLVSGNPPSLWGRVVWTRGVTDATIPIPKTYNGGRIRPTPENILNMKMGRGKKKPLNDPWEEPSKLKVSFLYILIYIYTFIFCSPHHNLHVWMLQVSHRKQPSQHINLTQAKGCKRLKEERTVFTCVASADVYVLFVRTDWPTNQSNYQTTCDLSINIYLYNYIYIYGSVPRVPTPPPPPMVSPPPPSPPPPQGEGESSLSNSLLKKLHLWHFLAKSRGEPFGGSQKQILKRPFP